MQVDLNDQRLQNIINEKNNTLSQVNSQYNQMINSSDKFYEEQKNLTKEYEQIQRDIQQKNTDFAIEKLEQQKDKSEKNYIKEQKGAYADYQKASNDYGVNAEMMATQGLTNSGVSETSRVSMYNTYQNRYATARQTFNDAILNYDNSIKDAQLQNNSKLAEISYNALKEQLEIGLQGFQYKNSLLEQQIQVQQSIENAYQTRWQNMLNQINTERELEERKRQFDAQMALEREQMSWQRSQSSGGGGSYELTDGNGSSGSQYGYFSNGYQPKGIDGYGAVSSTGKTVNIIKTSSNGKVTINKQNVWKTPDGSKWYWDGNTRTYKKYNGQKDIAI